jgi:predicted PhzF superfamily epimerase YddE/YHI9
MGTPGLYIWAWEDEAAGRLRSRYFATDYGILEDEATGAAAVVMGDRLGRPVTIRQGVGSEIIARPRDDGTVEIGGRVELVERREF